VLADGVALDLAAPGYRGERSAAAQKMMTKPKAFLAANYSSPTSDRDGRSPKIISSASVAPAGLSPS
jgi:hypothetical protein